MWVKPLPADVSPEIRDAYDKVMVCFGRFPQSILGGLSVLLALKLNEPGLIRIMSAIAFWLFANLGAVAWVLYPVHKNIAAVVERASLNRVGTALGVSALLLILGIGPEAIAYAMLAVMFGVGLALLYRAPEKQGEKY